MVERKKKRRAERKVQQVGDMHKKDNETYKICPSCRELIKWDAVICTYCRKEIKQKDEDKEVKEDKVEEVRKALVSAGWNITKLVFLIACIVIIIVILVMCFKAS